jgi:UDP-glucose 4-epimerase
MKIKKDILVTGGAGYIGSHVVRQLTETGREAVVFDNLSTGSAEALVHGEELVVGDLSDTAALKEIFQRHSIKTVLHFAASIVAPESVTNPIKYYSNNTRNTLNLLNVCSQFSVENIIFSSTAAVYGMTAQGVASEDSPTIPINPYGTSKLMSEWMLRDIALAHDMAYVALRYFNVAGADPLMRMGQRTPDATHLIKVCCQAALGMRDRVSVFGTDYQTPDGTGIRDYIHVEDLAAAHLDALSYLEFGGESIALNVGYGQGNSVREVIKIIKEISNVDFPVSEAPRRPGDPASLVAKADRIQELLAWRPRYNDLRTIVADAWRWEQRLHTMHTVQGSCS